MNEKPTYEQLKNRVRELEARDQERESRQHLLIDHINSGVVVYEPFNNGEDFIFKAFNRAAERITRLSQNEALGKRLSALFPHMDKSGLLEALRKVWKTGQTTYLPPFYYKDDIREGWRENRIYKLPTGEIVAIFDDVTEREQTQEALRESEEKFRTIFEQAGVGVALIEPGTGRFLMVNSRYAEIVGYTPDEMTGMTFIDITHPDDQAEALRNPERMASGETGDVRFERRYVRKDGATVWTQVTPSAM